MTTWFRPRLRPCTLALAAALTAAGCADDLAELEPATSIDGGVDGPATSAAYLAPALSITSGPLGPTRDATPTFTFKAVGAVAVQCRLDDRSWVACTSPVTLAALADGAHTFWVRAASWTGETTVRSRTFVVDTLAPTLAITGGPGITAEPTPSFTFVTGGAPIAVTCRVDAAPFVACASPYTTAPLADGAHLLTIRAEDVAGNATSVNRQFVVDTTP